ncbi:dethiobiotin synthase [Helicobacter sp. 13S00477-4]|uniref:dethiobiotin synthase n=1 Tax=Helicobacter sp. 13S00477-4 TaxID=1905759 RepID=UPI000BA71605|nr:dethiobiotin synthase [Helicobacter sp. 13S00477-4]PAF51616.1 dethiobiotin synthase [Helicobacter sp. 13S00477-4]
MKTIFISATNTNIGKTHTSCMLSDYLNQIGLKTLISKPIETGDNGKTRLDCQIHLEKNKKIHPKLTLEDINFYRYKIPASPFVAQIDNPKAPKIDFKYIAKKISELENKCDILLVEGAGGLLVPIDLEHNMFDLAKYLNAHLLLISSDKLGMINDLLLNKEFLKTKNITTTYVINMLDEKNYNKISKPYIDHLNNISKNTIHNLQKDISKITSEILLFAQDTHFENKYL